jgi:hypothetical protein
LAKAAGAVGVVFWNNDAGLVQGTYGGVLDDVVPATGISTADGEALVALAGNSTVLASLNVVTVIEEVQRYVLTAINRLNRKLTPRIQLQRYCYVQVWRP